VECGTCEKVPLTCEVKGNRGDDVIFVAALGRREAGAAGQAAAKAAIAQLARAHLQPDDSPAGHPGGLLPLPRLQVLPH